ncbi:MAG: DUF4423 domain-containing protein [Myxococcota bacterium]
MEHAARELLRAIRGPMSQIAFSRLLGYRTNTAADWESGRRSPTVHEALRAATRRRIDVAWAFRSFHPLAADRFDPEALGPWLDGLRGSTTNRAIAGRLGVSEHRVGRWLRGASEPRLPEFLALLQAITDRCSDLVARLVPIEAIPSLASTHDARSRVRRLVYDRPWTAAILTLLGVLQPIARPVPPIARALGVPEDEVGAVLDALNAAGVVAETERGWVVARRLTIDAAPTADDVRGLRAHWSRVSAARAAAPEPDDRFSYNVFNVSRADLARIHEVQAAAFREIRAIVAGSGPPEATALLVTHLFAWAVEPSEG